MANLLVAGLNSDQSNELDSLLKKSGFNVEYAVSFSSVLTLLQNFSPDLIVCVHNPGEFNGFQFLQQIDTHPKLNALRTIFISEEADRTSLRRAMALGADDFIPSPYTTSEIMDAIANQLKRSQSLTSSAVSSPPQTTTRSSVITLDQMQQEFDQLNRQSLTKETKSQLLVLGIDQHNWLRTTLGSHFSNALIERFTERLMNSQEALDQAFHIAIMDDQQFALLPYPGQEEKILNSLDELWQQSISQPIEIDAQELQITTSIAAIEFTLSETCNFETIIGQARQALDRLIKKGGNQFRSETFCPKSKSSYQFAIATNLARGLEEGEFHAYYQPQVDLASGKFVGVEALVRWHHPEWGTLEPAKFIPVAEKTAAITQIDERVLRKACQAIQYWQEKCLYPLRVSVNLSALSFNRPNLCETVKSILEEFDVAPQWIELEITESMLVQDTAKAAQIMSNLKSIGVSIALDDFGVGYSSLSYLQEFPIDTLKIDRCFIHNVDRNQGNAAITTAVIKLAHDLGLNVVAEGVERVEERNFLRQHQCNAMQGYLISHPVPQSVFETFLTAQNHQTTAMLAS